MILQTFSLNTSPSDPPKTMKSCEKTKTLRPSIVPHPVTTPSPYGRVRSIPKPCARCRAIASSSTNEPGRAGSRAARARSACRGRAGARRRPSRAASVASSRRFSSSAIFSSTDFVCGATAGPDAGAPSSLDRPLQDFLGAMVPHRFGGRRAGPRRSSAALDGADSSAGARAAPVDLAAESDVDDAADDARQQQRREHEQRESERRSWATP